MGMNAFNRRMLYCLNISQQIRLLRKYEPQMTICEWRGWLVEILVGKGFHRSTCLGCTSKRGR